MREYFSWQRRFFYQPSHFHVVNDNTLVEKKTLFLIVILLDNFPSENEALLLASFLLGKASMLPTGRSVAIIDPYTEKSTS